MDRIPVKVSNMIGNAGNPVRNQFIIQTQDGEYFQSYNTLIVFIPKWGSGKIQLDKHSWDCSVTTGKYRNRFLNEGIAETRRKIKEGVYELVDLNGRE